MFSVNAAESHPGLAPIAHGLTIGAAIERLIQADAQHSGMKYDIGRTEFGKFSHAGHVAFTGQYIPSREHRPHSLQACPLCAARDSGQLYLGASLRVKWPGENDIIIPLTILVNPFGYMPNGLTIAGEHSPQEWHSSSEAQKVVSELYYVAEALPQYHVIYNGVSAGASLPQHGHIQAFQLPQGHGWLALQRVGVKRDIDRGGPLRIGFQDEYPLAAFRVCGPASQVIPAILHLARQWEETAGTAATCNVLAATENERVAMYFVPRTKLFSKAPLLDLTIGALECSGSFVLSRDRHLELLRTDKINFDSLWRALEAVRPDDVEKIR